MVGGSRTLTLFGTIVGGLIACSAVCFGENLNSATAAVSCRHPSHGVERYERLFSVTRESAEVDARYTRPYWCGAVVGSLQNQYPGARVTITKADERSRNASCGFSTCTYQTDICTVRVEADPLYKYIAGPECQNADVK
jgi:hypothetical protein